MSFDLDSFLNEYTPAQVAVSIPTRRDLGRRLSDLRREIAEAEKADGSTNAPNAAPALREEADELAEQLKASEREFVFTELDQQTLSDLRAASKPTKEQLARRFDTNPEEFEARVLAAACVQPEGLTTYDDALKLKAKIGAEAYQKLIAAAFDAQKELQVPSF